MSGGRFRLRLIEGWAGRVRQRVRICVGGKDRYRRVGDQFLEWISFRLYEKSGIRHFFGDQVVPEPDIPEQ